VANISPFKIDGFDELNKNLKKLDDNVKRKEVLGILRAQSKPFALAYSAALPYRSGTLSKSVAVRALSKRRSGGNPVVGIRPGKRGKNDGYYKFMVIEKGSLPGSTARGSRKGINTVVEKARDRALRAGETAAILGNQKAVTKLVQRKIDKLSQ